MKLRVMVEGEDNQDFDNKVKAQQYAEERKSGTATKRIVDVGETIGRRPRVTIHSCHHDENGVCDSWRDI